MTDQNAGYLEVKNWGSFQQYKDHRDMKWIKFYTETLDDYEIDQLSETAQSHLFKIWLLSAKHENRIPNDPAWIARKINAKSKVNVKQLVTLGFLVLYESVQECTETYLYKEYKEDKQYKEETHCVSFDDFWDAYAKKVDRKFCESWWMRAKWTKLGVTPDDLVVDAHRRHAEDDKWPKYQPNPKTYLNGERWNDEISKRDCGDHTAKTDADAARYLAEHEAIDGEVVAKNVTPLRTGMGA